MHYDWLIKFVDAILDGNAEFALLVNSNREKIFRLRAMAISRAAEIYTLGPIADRGACKWMDTGWLCRACAKGGAYAISLHLHSLGRDPAAT